MKANKSWKSLTIVGVLGIVLLFSAGYFLGYAVHNQSTSSLESELVNSSDISQPVSASTLPNVRKSNALNDVADLKDLTLFKSHFDRTLALNRLLKNATVELLKAYAEQSKSISTIHWRNTAQQATFQRLASLNPKVALEQIKEMPIEARHPLLQTIFQECSLANLDQAIEYANQLDNKGKLSALNGILMSMEHLTQEEQRAVARRLGNEWVALEKIELEKDLELFEDPEREWNDFLSNNNNNLDSLDAAQSKMLVFIATAWIARDGIEVFAKIRESFPNQYPLLETVSSIVNKLFPHHPQVALEMAAHVEGVSYWHREKIVREFLTPWAEIAPQEALEAVNRVEGPYLRRLFQSLVFEIWAVQDAKTLWDMTNNLPADLQGMAQEQALIAMAKTTPTDAVELLSEISDQYFYQNVLEGIAIQWTQHDMFGVLNWIESDELVAKAQERLTKKVIAELSKTDPELAFQTALKYPPDSNEEGMEAHVIQSLAFGGDIDKALSLLQQTRKGKTRTQAYGSIIDALLLVDEETQRSHDAVDLFVQAVTVDSVEKFGFMLLNLSTRAPLILFDSIDDLPSKELKRIVAISLLTHNEDNGMFTEDQLSELEELKVAF